MMQIIYKLKCAAINLLVLLLNLFIRRDKQVFLFGAWMGSKFADNSRFWFQFLHENKEKYGIRRVIWVTRNKEVFAEMISMGYEVHMMRSGKSIYWHLKAGVHVICNMFAQTGKYSGDILGELSFGAKRIVLWHGVGIKACGYLTNPMSARAHDISTLEFEKMNRRSIIRTFLSVGGWRDRYFLTTGKENTRVYMLDFRISKDRIIEANYPRENDNFVLMKKEIEVSHKIQEAISQGKKIVLYLPTFRNCSTENERSKYIYPLRIDGFVDYIKKNNILWIEKLHSSDSSSGVKEAYDNVFLLGKDFDVNVIYKYIELLITDFSSASSDCIFRWKKTISFVPDFEQYRDDDRGFVNDYSLYYPGYIIYDPADLADSIDKALSNDFFDAEMKNKYQDAVTLLFDNHSADMNWITDMILKSIS